MPKVKCEECGKEHYTEPSRLKRNKHFFCSNRCFAEWTKRTHRFVGRFNPAWKGGSPIFECEVCGKKFARYVCKKRQQKVRFCSRKCQGIKMSQEKKGKGTGPRPHTWKDRIVIPEEQWKLGYIAGLIDGEGSIVWNKGRIQISITNTHKATLQNVAKWLHCGSLDHGKMSEGGTKLCYALYFYPIPEVQKLLKAIQPYLNIKQDKANKALLELAEVI